ncbi:MAG: hypothetical protein HY567_03595 [Candidatus Kerfeldbacteria bacterium]|nr:hypothetical protein [Candidatus Kerfeldbacteria bacterium]
MELRQAIDGFARRQPLGWGIVAVVVVAAFTWSYARPVTYTNSISFSVNRINKEATTDYQYDGFYALQAADLFAQTVVSWLQTPSVLVEIYDRAGISSNAAPLRTLTSRFKTKKYSAQNIVVTYSTPTEEEGQRIAKALTDVLSARTAAVNRTAAGEALFEVPAAKPVVVKATPDPWLVGVLAVVIGVTLSIFLIPLVDYLARAQPRP